MFSFQGSSPGTQCPEAPASTATRKAGALKTVRSEAGASERVFSLVIDT